MDEDLVALLTVLAVAVIAVALGYWGGQAMRARHVRQHFTGAAAAPSASPTAQQVSDFVAMGQAMQGGPGRLASFLRAGSAKLAKDAPDQYWPSCAVLLETLDYVDNAVVALNAASLGLPGTMAAAHAAAIGSPNSYTVAIESLNANLGFYAGALNKAAINAGITHSATSTSDEAAGLTWAAAVNSLNSSKNAKGGQYLWFTPSGVPAYTVINALFPL